MHVQLTREIESPGPLVSVVTVHFRDYHGLKNTMRSLLASGERNELQWVVIDGASHPESPEDSAILDAVASEADIFVSEQDNGIYDAMNKGTRNASGKLVLYLNAGDEWFESFSLVTLRPFLDDGATGMVWGSCLEQRSGSPAVLIRARRPGWAWYGMPAYHPAILFRRDILGARPYDASFDIAADYDLVCRLLRSGVTVGRVDVIISRFHLGGKSDTGHAQLLKEEKIIRQRHWNLPGWIAGAIPMARRFMKGLAGFPRFRSIWRKWA